MVFFSCIFFIRNKMPINLSNHTKYHHKLIFSVYPSMMVKNVNEKSFENFRASSAWKWIYQSIYTWSILGHVVTHMRCTGEAKLGQKASLQVRHYIDAIWLVWRNQAKMSWVFSKSVCLKDLKELFQISYHISDITYITIKTPFLRKSRPR